VDAVRATLPAELPLLVRISATDWYEGGWDLDQSIALAKVLKAHDVALLDVSSGGLTPHQVMHVGPGYQTPFSARVRAEAGIPTGAVGMITDVIVDAFEATRLTADDIDWFVPHQANKRIIDASAHKLHIAPQKVVLTVDRHGNTSAASIPLALAVAVADGRIKRDNLVLLEAMGGGFTWGSVLIRW